MIRVGELVRVQKSECPLHKPEDPPREEKRESYPCFCAPTVFRLFADGMVGVQSKDDYVMLVEPKRLVILI
jgi:hypothetical protein